MLRERLTQGEMIFSDRQIDGAVGWIDHLVVASSGVWAIDAKKRTGVWYRETSPSGGEILLYSGRQDISGQVEKLSRSLDAVSRLLRDASVPIRPAVAILPDQCRLITGLRLRMGKAVTHGSTVICSPAVLIEQISQPGPLTHDQVVRIGHRLDEALMAR
jgi:hypothetical protein